MSHAHVVDMWLQQRAGYFLRPCYIWSQAWKEHELVKADLAAERRRAATRAEAAEAELLAEEAELERREWKRESLSVAGVADTLPAARKTKYIPNEYTM